MKRMILGAGVVMVIVAGSVAGQTAELTIWELPVRNTNLFDLCGDEEGHVFVALPGSRSVAVVDPASDSVCVLPVGESPVSLAWTSEGLFFTFYGGVGFLDPHTGETAAWPVPRPVGRVRSLVNSEVSTALVTLWFVQESPDKLGRFEASTIAPTAPAGDAGESPEIELQAVHAEVSATVDVVVPRVHALDSPILFRTVGAYHGEFTRWTPFVRTRGVDRIATGPMARMWFSQNGDSVFLFESYSDSFFRYSLPEGTVAGSVTASSLGTVWFIDTSLSAVCQLDPEANEVAVWPLPGDDEPYDLAAGAFGVWISDRTGGALYHLDPATGEFRRWEIGPDTEPSALWIDAEGVVWFIEEASRAIGRLTVDALIAREEEARPAASPSWPAKRPVEEPGGGR